MEVQRLQRARDLPLSHAAQPGLLDWIERHRRELQESASGRRLANLDRVSTAVAGGGAGPAGTRLG